MIEDDLEKPRVSVEVQRVPETALTSVLCPNVGPVGVDLSWGEMEGYTANDDFARGFVEGESVRRAS